MKLVLCISLVLGLSFLGSCSSSTTTPPVVVKNYMPLKAGNYWLYSRQAIDTVDHAPKGFVFTDSAYVMDSISYKGRGCFRVVYVQLDSAKRDTSYFAKNSDGSVYTFVNFNVAQLSSVAPSLIAPTAWVQIKPSETGATTWTSIDTTLAGVDVNIGGGTTKTDLLFKVTGEKGVSKTVSIGANSYTADEYIQTALITGFGGAISFKLTQHFWFIENVGLYMSRTDDAAVFFSTSTLFKTPGTQSTMLRFKTN